MDPRFTSVYLKHVGILVSYIIVVNS